MFKRIGLLAILAAILAFPAYSQNASPSPKLSMWNRGVFNLYASDGNTKLGPSWMGNVIPQGPYNSLSFDYAVTNVSWTMTAQWDGDGRAYPIFLRDYSGTISMFDGIARFTGGKVWAGDEFRFRNFDTTGFATRIANGETGFMVRLYPLRGLAVGVFVPIPVADQSASLTYASMNFGAEWVLNPNWTFRSSYRFEPDSFGNKEFAIGVSTTAVNDLVLTIGYTNRDVSLEHDFFLDASFNLDPLAIRACADLNLIAGNPIYGGKILAEYAFPATPFVAGASLSYGTGDVWWNNGFEAYPYLRYAAGGSSVQIGGKVVCDTSLAYQSYSIQLMYTVGF